MHALEPDYRNQLTAPAVSPQIGGQRDCRTERNWLPLQYDTFTYDQHRTGGGLLIPLWDTRGNRAIRDHANDWEYFCLFKKAPIWGVQYLA